MAKIGDDVDPQELQSFTQKASHFESLASQPLIGWMLDVTKYFVLLLATLVAVASTVIWCLGAISEANVWARFVTGAVVGAAVGILLLLVALNLYWAVEKADSSARFYGTSIAPVLGGGIGAIGGAIVAATAGLHYLEGVAATDWGRVLLGSSTGAVAGNVALVGLRVLFEISSKAFSFFQFKDKLVQESLESHFLAPYESFLAILLYELPFLFWVGGLIGAIAGAIFSQL
ncbi:MAG: hypothetical protein KME42_17545 [Tildeniella nuda ZEHNDER 1965/U140]|jgi:hypothetical protein|nr:hypothetical protein [Tildeniella nuda ZEHNDER 1965/U140]